MTYAELIKEVAKDAKLSRGLTAKVLASFLNISKHTLMSGEEVTLRSMGKLVAGRGRNGPLFGGTRSGHGVSIIRFKRSRTWKSTPS